MLPYFYTGLQLNLTCLIQLAPHGGISISAHWSKSGSTLTSSSQVRVMEEAVEVEPLVYRTTVVFSSLDKARGGDYTCSVTVTSPRSPAVMANATQSVIVESKHHTTMLTYLSYQWLRKKGGRGAGGLGGRGAGGLGAAHLKGGGT